ncbi:uncharacterized protein C11orf16 homolog [Antennarius striatus]|uniref:uncharacterized protein C11orf16 homolog n=1 Tax=Antennarius striatus TaxID=241820 RepID=UPI0035B26176
MNAAGMASWQTASDDALIPALLGGHGCSVTFVVDVSEGGAAVLGSAKRLLIRTLLTKASFRDSLFNILAFSSKVTCWSHHMLPCSPDAVYAALSWIRSIGCGPGRDLLSALEVVFMDPGCHAVHLLATGPPDRPEAVMAALPALAAGRPMNVFYLQDSGVHLDGTVRDYLQCLTLTTRGSCYVILVGLNGGLVQLIPLDVVETPSPAPPVSSLRCCCPPTSAFIPRSPTPLLRCSLGNPLRSGSSCGLSGKTSGPEFFPGCQVLARREVDGLYHIGTVIEEVQGRGGLWVVQFDGAGATGSGAVCPHRQLVCSPDMMKLTRGHATRPAPGDAVLSPWEPELRRYGPGRVIAGPQRRGDGVACFPVLMWNRRVSLVPSALVFPIPAPHHDRIVRELRISTSASGCRWIRPRCSSCAPQMFSSRCFPPPSRCCSSTNPFPPGCGGVGGFERTEQGADVRKSEDEFSSSSSLSEDETGPTFSPAVKLRSRAQRPPWRYWRRTGPEPQHRQPGSAATRRLSKPVTFSSPLPQVAASTNHSSLFQSLPGRTGRRVNTHV